MMVKSSHVHTVAAVCLIVSVFCGCALLDPLVGKTSTSQGNANMGLGEYKGIKHAIGCIDFKNESGWSGQWEIGQNCAIMLESALFDTGRFVLVEREKLKDVIAEQDLVDSGRAAKAKKVATKGVIRPARYIGTGAITEAEDSQSGGGGGISFGGISLGGGKSKAKVTIIAKLIDTSTGEIVAKERIEGLAGRANMEVGLNYKGLSTSAGGFKKTPMGEAVQDCINQAAVFFAKKMEAMPFDATVVKVADGKVIINRGAEFGIEVGKAMEMREEGEVLTDPDTGAVLGNEEGKLIGELAVEKVLEKISYCTVTSGEKKPKPGTQVLEKKQ